MDYYQKVHWSEGMFLTPHHFQQNSRYFERLLRDHTRSLQPFLWGVFDLSLDSEALTQGTISLTHFKGILPDGLWLNTPEIDVLPPSRKIKDDLLKDDLDIFIGIPSIIPGTIQCQWNGDSEARRYKRVDITIKDENAQSNEKIIGAMKKEIRLFIGNENSDHYTLLKIAQIKKTPPGRVRC